MMYVVYNWDHIHNLFNESNKSKVARPEGVLLLNMRAQTLKDKKQIETKENHEESTLPDPLLLKSL